jgi:tetratricopeptide (TPR) repeat protein
MPELDKNVESGSIFQHSDCLTLEQLTAYAEERVSAEERFVIEKHLVDCELCSDALDGFALLQEKGGIQDRIKLLNEDIGRTASTYRARKRNRRIYYSLAAAIVVAFTAVLYFRAPAPSYAPLFAEYFKPYPNMIPIVRGEGSSGALESAMAEYENANYGEALTILKTLIAGEPQNDTASFYAGVSSLCLNDSRSAIVFLQNVSEHSGLTDQTTWYLGLAYLKQNDMDAAKGCFGKLSSKEGIFKQRSIEMLSGLQ